MSPSLFHDWIQACQVAPETCWERHREADSSVGHEALMDHPAQGNSDEAVGTVVLNRASTYFFN